MATDNSCLKVRMGTVVKFSRHAWTSETGSLNPKTDGETCLPLDANAELTSKKQSCEILPRADQLLTAEVPTRATSAARPGPPSASITSCTVLSMSFYSSRRVKLSRLHKMELEKDRVGGSNTRMQDKVKALSRRLKITREALGLSAAELCRSIDCKPNRWSQYENGDRKLTLEVAEALCDEFGLSLDWLYRGDPARLPHELRMKMRNSA